jgi:hypothetical protein
MAVQGAPTLQQYNSHPAETTPPPGATEPPPPVRSNTTEWATPNHRNTPRSKLKGIHKARKGEIVGGEKDTSSPKKKRQANWGTAEQGKVLVAVHGRPHDYDRTGVDRTSDTKVPLERDFTRETFTRLSRAALNAQNTYLNLLPGTWSNLYFRAFPGAMLGRIH